MNLNAARSAAPEAMRALDCGTRSRATLKIVKVFLPTLGTCDPGREFSLASWLPGCRGLRCVAVGMLHYREVLQRKAAHLDGMARLDVSMGQCHRWLDSDSPAQIS